MIVIILFGLALILSCLKFKFQIEELKKPLSRIRKILEFWNDFVNFFIPGLIAYYFISVRWSQIANGYSVNFVDISLLLIFIIGLFGHLSVLSYNITEGIEAIIKRYFGDNLRYPTNGGSEKKTNCHKESRKS